MKTIKATFANGDSITTRINGSESEIRAYYLGNRFCVSGSAETTEIFSVCTEVEFIG